jgi:hypothetical protein
MGTTEFGGPAVEIGVPQGQSSVAAGAAETDLDPGAIIDQMPQGQKTRAAPAIEDVCARLMSLQRKRAFCIRMQSRHERSVEAYIRVQMGFNPELPADQRKQISAEARRIRTTVERGGGRNGDARVGLFLLAAADVSAVILTSAQGRALWDSMRQETEAEMARLARRLPAYRFVARVKGVSAKALAVIVGEAGNLSNYPDRSRLQKRLSIGCVDGMRQGNPGPGATPEDWIRHGYKKTRRAEICALVDDVMLRAQWRGDKDADGKNPEKTGKPVAVPAHAIGPYGEHYARKKTEYIARRHPAPDRAARRYMAKMFIRDFWRACCQAEREEG